MSAEKHHPSVFGFAALLRAALQGFEEPFKLRSETRDVRFESSSLTDSPEMSSDGFDTGFKVVFPFRGEVSSFAEAYAARGPVTRDPIERYRNERAKRNGDREIVRVDFQGVLPLGDRTH